jgi:Co/Zn/Cd efflux system component
MKANLRKVVLLVASLNLAYFGIEFAVALAIGSVSLFADSVDFLEDASINFLIAVALGWSAAWRARLERTFYNLSCCVTYLMGTKPTCSTIF